MKLPKVDDTMDSSNVFVNTLSFKDNHFLKTYTFSCCNDDSNKTERKLSCNCVPIKTERKSRPYYRGFFYCRWFSKVLSALRYIMWNMYSSWADHFLIYLGTSHFYRLALIWLKSSEKVVSFVYSVCIDNRHRESREWTWATPRHSTLRRVMLMYLVCGENNELRIVIITTLRENRAFTFRENVICTTHNLTHTHLCSVNQLFMVVWAKSWTLEGNSNQFFLIKCLVETPSV